jgi:hypothetical protein
MPGRSEPVKPFQKVRVVDAPLSPIVLLVAGVSVAPAPELAVVLVAPAAAGTVGVLSVPQPARSGRSVTHNARIVTGAFLDSNIVFLSSIMIDTKSLVLDLKKPGVKR